MTFSAYDRGTRGVGIRDHILIVPSVGCTNRQVELSARARPDLRIVTHQHGCGMLGDDAALTSEILGGVCANPNVRGAVVVSLGCETNQPVRVVRAARQHGGDARIVVFQDVGGTEETIDAVSRAADELLSEPVTRREASISDLTVGLVSDPGMNTTELIDAVRDRLSAAGSKVLTGGPPLTGVFPASPNVPHAWTPDHRRRLEVVDPLQASDPSERLTAFAAAGAQIAVLFTARGNPAGSAVMPTVKVGTDLRVAEILPGVIDVATDGSASFADEIVESVLRAASGQLVGAEEAGMRDFAVPRIAPTM